MTISKTPDYYRPSLASRLLTTQYLGSELLQATGFLVVHNELPYLISNWHVFAGLAPNLVGGRTILDSKGCRLPDAVKIRHVRSGDYVNFIESTESLVDESGPLWLEHPEHGSMVDIGALPLTQIKDVEIIAHDPWMPMFIQIGVGDDLTIVGYPFGVQSHGFAIWTRGHIASEFDLDYQDLPCFLIDSRTREGQSGSPAIFFRTGSYFGKFGEIMMVKRSAELVLTPGQPIPEDYVVPHSNVTEQFLGIYSGRIDKESDLGRVWRPSAIRDVIERGVRAKI
ncbi:hypothetical protein [Nevskia sp.]|uniref:hypothetical protein n=1 Tax=Nevskia sp. TaxID=1929292 RepID=UPI0025D5C59D|nr:hypothetical protein [Nevskia sp.]